MSIDNVIEVIFMTWVGWPIYTALAIFLGYWIWETHDEHMRAKQGPPKLKMDLPINRKKLP